MMSNTKVRLVMLVANVYGAAMLPDAWERVWCISVLGVICCVFWVAEK